MMPSIRLETRRVEKPWGRRTLWQGFEDAAPDGDPVGEVWFEEPNGDQPELLIKYLFTNEKLSIQVHPNDSEARARGYPRGKDEAWVVLDAEPHATIAIGTHEVLTREELKQSALDGSIENKVDWKTIKAGDFYYSPAGTVHAIGPGLTLIEVQQNVDLTYRLYDYGRPRELHLEDGVAVSDPVPYVAPSIPFEQSAGRLILTNGPAFVLERWSGEKAGTIKSDGRLLWIIPVSGSAKIDGSPLQPGGVWLVKDQATLSIEANADILIAYPGSGLNSDIWTS